LQLTAICFTCYAETVEGPMRSWLLFVTVGLIGCGGSDASVDGGGPDGTADVAPSDGTGGDTGSDGSMMMTDTGTDTGTDGGTGVTRLFVTTQDGVAVWDNPESIAADVMPTTTLNHASVSGGKARGIALLGKRLFVGANGNPILVAFDLADIVMGGMSPAVQLPISAVTGSNNVFDAIYVDSATNTLWPVSFNNGAQLFTMAATLNSSAFSRAQYTHSFMQLPGFAFDAANKRLFLGQISGAGMLAWNSADTKLGIFNTPDFTVVSTQAFWSIAIAQNRMYAGNTVSPMSIAVWSNLGAVNTATAPTFSMTGAGSGLPASGGFIPHVAVTNDVLVVTIQANTINLYKNASALAGQAMPSPTITSNMNNPKKTILAKSNKLYVLDSEGVAIFKDATTTPVFVAKVKMGLNNVRDFVLME
jgi:hypothetical protein